MFTPYYILAVGFGAFAVIISVIGMKRPNDFPGRFSGAIVLAGLVIGIATLVFVWRGGEKEEEHRDHEQAGQAAEAAAANPLPAGIQLSVS